MPEPPVTVPDLALFQAGTEEPALAAALASVRGLCRWHIAPSRTETFALYSADGLSVFVPTMALTEVVGVSQLGVTVGATSYEWTRGGVVTLLTGSFDRARPVTVEVEHGHADIPADVSRVVVTLAQRMLDARRRTVALASTTSGPFTEVLPSTWLTDSDREELSPHQLSTGFA